jgi:CBS domain-containing protein
MVRLLLSVSTRQTWRCPVLVSEVMTPNPIVALATTPVADVLEQMSAEEIRHMPVVDRGALIGVISDRDLKGYPVDVLLQEPDAARGRLRRPVSHLMTGDPISVTPETELSETVDLLLENKIGAVPVCDPEGNVVGIVSYVDVLRAARDLL